MRGEGVGGESYDLGRFMRPQVEQIVGGGLPLLEEVSMIATNLGQSSPLPVKKNPFVGPRDPLICPGVSLATF